MKMNNSDGASQRLQDFPKAVVYAWAGLSHLVRNQLNARVHLILAVLAIILALWLKLNVTQWAILALTIGFVFAAEALNTTVEAIVDLVSPEYHPFARIAKDTAAGAVLVSALTALAVAAFLFLPKLLAFF